MKNTAPVRGAFRAYFPVHQSGVIVTNRQANSRAPGRRLPLSVGLKKAVEYVRQIVGMDAGSRVGYLKRKGTWLYLHRNLNRTRSGRELEGIGEQVVKNLSALFPVEVGHQIGCNFYIVCVMNPFPLGQ